VNTASSIPTRLLTALLLIQLVALPFGLQAQDYSADVKADEPTKPTLEKSAIATTTANPDIEKGYLSLLFTPLTRDDLLVEVTAWQDLLKANLKQISDAEIQTRQTNPENEQANASPPVATAAESNPQQREQLIAALATLRNEKSGLIDRLNLALDAYEEKGGDGTEFRQYVAAVAGIQVDVTDTAAFRSALKTWLTSEKGGRLVLHNLLVFVAVLVVFWLLSSVVGRMVRKAVERQAAFSDLLKKFINTMVRRTILLIGLLVAISVLGVNVSALFALLGGGAFVIGFALQDTLSNFAAGVMVLVYRPFDIGDVVKVGGVEGIVGGVSLVSTTIRTFDNKSVLVPNKSVWGEVITNSTANQERRVDLVFGIGYEDDIDKAQGILERLVAEHELILEEPASVIKVHELADSSVNFICRPWTKTENYWEVYWDLTRRVKDAFDADDVSIPYPQLDVHSSGG
jgi:small conductance mechanosensitive channel